MPFPLVAGAAIGAAQTGIGLIGAAKAQRDLEKMQSPIYAKNKGILDYFDKALNRYQTPGTESSFYKRNMRDISRNTSQAISTLNDRGGANAGIGKIMGVANDATLDANVAAENMTDQRFRELGAATEMKAGEDRMDYQYNKLAPFERKWNLKAAKAAGKNQLANAGLTNVGQSLNQMGQYGMLKEYYKNTDNTIPAGRRLNRGILSGVTG